jgi:hypothetical protein
LLLIPLSLGLAGCQSTAAGQALPAPPVAAPPPAAAVDAGAPARETPVLLQVPPPGAIAGLDPPVVDIEDPHASLTRFYERTEALLRGRSREPVRIAVYGDSNGTMDYVSGEMRRVLQTAHGDAGHGFVALSRPWEWYRHQYVVADYQKEAWDAYTVTTRPTPSTTSLLSSLDPWYGQGLIVAQSHQTGAAASVATAPEGAPVGTHVSRVEFWYLAWPTGGAFDVKVDGEVKAGADTHAEGDPHFGFVRVDMPDGAHKVMAVTRSAKPVRLLGAVLERDEPGFQVDGLGVGSLNCLCMLRESEALDHEILAHRPYDLIVFHIGSNTWNPAVMDPVQCMKETIARFRRATPDVSVMIMTPPDRAENGMKKTPRWLLRVEDELRRASQESPSAFFDFRSAMGGEGSMAQFHALHLDQGDGLHFNAKGGAYVGGRVVDALARSFAAWEEKRR